jgi:hypothetical protein
MSSTMNRSAMLAAPRQIWLATLGAAAVTRDWAGKEAGSVFRTLVNEGSVVESRAIRVLGRRVEASVKRANALVGEARSSVRASVESLASAASAFVRTRLPTVRASIDVENAAPKRSAKPVRRAQAATRTPATKRRAAKSRAQK